MSESKPKPSINPLLLIVLVVAGGGIGYVAGLQLAYEGLEEVYARNYAYVGAGIGLILGLILGRRRRA